METNGKKFIGSKEEVDKLIEKTLQMKIEAGDGQSQFLLGQHYFESNMYDMANLMFTNAYVNNDDYQALYQLAVMAFDGLNGVADQATGFEYMMKVAESVKDMKPHLYAAACYNIAQAYYYGVGIRQDDANAVTWWLKVASVSVSPISVLAQTALGLFYGGYSSIGDPDFVQSFNWHQEAADNGSVQSKGILGVFYMHGIGTEQNYKKAFCNLSKAASEGDVYAGGNFSYLLFKRKMYTKAAQLASNLVESSKKEVNDNSINSPNSYVKKGLAVAHFILARCLQKGLGVIQDDLQFLYYYKQSFLIDSKLCAILHSEFMSI